jgi:hypothetical protein
MTTPLIAQQPDLPNQQKTGPIFRVNGRGRSRRIYTKDPEELAIRYYLFTEAYRIASKFGKEH